MIFMGLPGRCSFSPRVSPSRVPLLSCAHYIQAPATLHFFWYIFSLIARQTLLNLIGIAINAIVVLISKGLVYKCVCRKVVPGEESPAYPRNLGEPSFHKIPYKTC